MYVLELKRTTFYLSTKWGSRSALPKSALCTPAAQAKNRNIQAQMGGGKGRDKRQGFATARLYYKILSDVLAICLA